MKVSWRYYEKIARRAPATRLELAEWRKLHILDKNQRSFVRLQVIF
jgi:hypothetical protein